jgi:hypothetical protein
MEKLTFTDVDECNPGRLGIQVAWLFPQALWIATRKVRRALQMAMQMPPRDKPMHAVRVSMEGRISTVTRG